MNAWDGLLEALPWIAATTALFAVGSSGVNVLVRYLALRRERDTLRKADTAAAIASDDLSTLGYHLFERLGSTTVRSYLSDDEVRSDIAHALAAVRNYLGGSAATAQGSDPLDGAAAQPTKPDAPLPQGALTEDTWTQLARARRDLELALGSALDIDLEDRRLAAAQLVALAREQAVLSAEEGETLRRAVNVANRAVHGTDVDPDAALEALIVMTRISERVTRASKSPSKAKKQRKTSETRYVVRGEHGWEVRAEGAKRASAVTTSQREAIDRARDIVYESGGGEVIIQGNDGKVRARDTVARKTDSAPR